MYIYIYIYIKNKLMLFCGITLGKKLYYSKIFEEIKNKNN